MKPYDSAAKCPKCGGDSIITNYAPERPHVSPSDEDRVKREHLRRRCGRCYYSWNEAPIHHPKPAKEKPDMGTK